MTHTTETAPECFHAELARAAGAAMNAADRWSFGPAETLLVLAMRILSAAEPGCPLAVVRTERGADIVLTLGGEGLVMVRFIGAPFAGIADRVGPGADFAVCDEQRKKLGLVEPGEPAIRARLGKAVELAVGETCARGMGLEETVLSVVVRALNEVSHNALTSLRSVREGEEVISLVALNGQYAHGEIVVVGDTAWLAAARSLFPIRHDAGGAKLH